MLPALYLLAGLVLASEPAPQESGESRGCIDKRGPGKLAWFDGTWDELAAEASKSQRVVFVDFWTKGCAYCKEQEVTFSVDSVVSEMEPLLCFSVDAETKDGNALTRKFNVRGYPTLLFLEPDGTLRDRISGYYAPEPFLGEVRRIKRNENTFSGLRAKIARDPDDLEARWTLAKKLKAIGDVRASEDQVAQILARDPEGVTAAARRLKLVELCSSAGKTLELEPLYAFLAQETDSALLFDGWLTAWKLEGQLMSPKARPEKFREHRARWFVAARRVWPHVPPESRGPIGNNIAWSFYEHQDELTPEDRVFALEVARQAAEAAPNVPAIVDTLACCLFAAGKREEAIAEIERCIRLDPKNRLWRDRLAEFRYAR